MQLIMKNFDASTFLDGYKTGHRIQYPENTTLVYSNLTPRSSRLANVIRDRYDDTVVVFGIQSFIKEYLIKEWNETFFERPKKEVIEKYQRLMDAYLGPNQVTTEHLEDLHDLGFLPLCIKALPEGTHCPIKVPMLTIYNTNPDFFWLTNYLETVMSSELWKPCTTATIANEYRKMLVDYAQFTGSPVEFVPFQGHDFSFRGMSGRHDAARSGAGHLTSFVGTDTIPSLNYIEEYYNANIDNELIGCSVNASEHSVASMNSDYSMETPSDLPFIKRMINDVYPSGIVSIIADTFDYFRMITEYAKKLKQDILSRKPDINGNAKVVFRPDSSDPVKIICGDPDAPVGTPERKGSLQCLWEVFGGTVNAAGYKVLDPHVGLIYGDSITLERCRSILARMSEAGFASGNIVFGIGSFTYQYLTRDTFGFAMKATYGEVNHVGREIFKNPKTDSGVKKSAKGLLRVDYNESGQITLYDQQSWQGEKSGLLREVFRNGRLMIDDSFSEIRKRVQK